MGALKVGPDNVEAIATIAASIRRRADQEIPPFSTQQMIAECYPGTIVTGRKLPANCHEFVVIDRHAFRSHRAPHFIVYRRGLSGPEQRFAIAHGLGHIIFDGAAHAGCLPHDKDRERRCDLFAAELLVPLDELAQFVCAWPSHVPDEHETYLDMVDQIASQFQVTADLINQRIQDLRG